MKKTIKYLLIFLITLTYILLPNINNKVQAYTKKPNVSAHAYVVMDSNTGQILDSKDAYKKIYPASTAKLMTALVALENGNLSQKIVVKQSVLNTVPYDASQLNLKVGHSYTLNELLHMLLIYSDASSANVIAHEIGGSIQNFVNMMNKKAKSLGLNSTNFDNAIGMDGTRFPNTYSTANDIAKLTQYAMKNQTIRNIVKKPTYNVSITSNNKSKTIYNTNKFLRGEYYPKDLYTIIGTKTGTTDLAGYVLSTTAIDKNGHEIICSFFGNNSSSKRYNDIEALLTYTYKNFKSGWVNSNNKWYYYENGQMLTDWKKLSGNWYYFNDDGSMRTGWLKLSDNWYYLNDDGSMRTGWLKLSDNWYYLNDDGSMRTGWLKLSDNWYYLNDDGSMRTGWLKLSDNWYYLNDDGSMRTGWLKLSDNWYYLNDDGRMVTDTYISGWYIDKNGIAQTINIS